MTKQEKTVWIVTKHARDETSNSIFEDEKDAKTYWLEQYGPFLVQMGENNNTKVKRAHEIYLEENLDNIQKADKINKELEGDFYNNGDTKIYEMDVITKTKQILKRTL